jgi:DNA-directed RNA polymerase subunit RPC12/RpoP
MADRPVQAVYEAVCPHCGKTFEGELLTADSSPRARGFKCPHCKLFVPYERANGPEPEGTAA